MPDAPVTDRAFTTHRRMADLFGMRDAVSAREAALPGTRCSARSVTALAPAT